MWTTLATTRRAATVFVVAILLLTLHDLGSYALAQSMGHEGGAPLPGDDFYGYANHAWLSETDLPDGKSSWGPSMALADETSQRVLRMIAAISTESTTDLDANTLRDFYSSVLDDSGIIEAKGVEPLRPLLQEIDHIHSRNQLAQYLGRNIRTGVETALYSNFDGENLFGLWITQGFDDSLHYQPYLLQGGLGMPDRENYVSSDPHMVELRHQYQAHIASMLKLAGFFDAERRATRVFELETKIAQCHTTRQDSDDEWKAHNTWRIQDFMEKAPGLDWKSFFKNAGLDKQKVFTIWHPSAISGAAALLAQEDLETWKDYFAFHVINHYSSVLPKAFVQQHFDFHERVLLGTAEMPGRPILALHETNMAIAEVLGRMYANHYFSAADKDRVQTMVMHIKNAYSKHIDSLSWMSDATRVQAQEKLKMLYVGVGYPEHWTSTDNLTVSETDALGNVVRAERFHTSQQLAKLGRPYDRGEWATYPHVTLALNMGMQNQLNFAAAYLQPPYFDRNASDASNYGSIGVIIGHEINHMFDETGARFDAQARLRNWWTPEELVRYKSALSPLIQQYSSYQPFSDLHINGEQTVIENTADVVGLKVAYNAYRASLGDSPKSLEDDRQFFIGFAQARRAKVTDEEIRKQIANDTHAPTKFRIATVRNLDAWYQAFDVKQGQALYLEPAARVQKW